MKTKAQKTISLVVGAIGLALVAMMVTVEGEPGLLPLVLVLLGAAGYATALLRERAGRP